MSDADLDLVTVACKNNDCTNEFKMPWDAMAFGFGGSDAVCGQCGTSSGFEIIEDPEEIKQ